MERGEVRSALPYLIVSFFALEGLFVESIAIVGDQRNGRIQQQIVGDHVESEIVAIETKRFETRTQTNSIGDLHDLNSRERVEVWLDRGTADALLDCRSDSVHRLEAFRSDRESVLSDWPTSRATAGS